MKHIQNFIRWTCCLIMAVLSSSCSEDKISDAGQEYGYVQFSLSKSTTRSEQLDYLGKVCKVRVDMVTIAGEHLSQTLNVYAKNGQTAELGMQSDKWMLFAGQYKVTGYELFDNLDRPLLTRSYNTEDYLPIQIVPGGVSMQELLVSVIGRGHVRFRLVKDNAVPKPETRVGGVKKYPFHNIQSVDVRVQSFEDNKIYDFKELQVEYKNAPSEDDPNYITAVSTCDSLLSLPAGTYRVIRYATYFDKNHSSKLAESNDDVTENRFVIEDNRSITADVPVTLDESSDYIKDAYNLYKIWLALDGPNWSYTGTTYPKGCNWEFEGRDIDLWLAQPGVKILETGRVAHLNFEYFGAKGEMPAALGELTELRQLYFGSHSSEPGYASANAIPAAIPGNNTINADEIAQDIQRMRTSFHETYCSNGHPLESFSEEMQLAFELNGIAYEKTRRPLKALPVDNDVNYVTQITSLEHANMGNLKNLQSLYIAYSPIIDLPSDLAGCESLTDVEIFACPDIEVFPAVLADMPKLISLTFSCNRNVTNDAMIAGLTNLNVKALEKPDGSMLQMLYLPAQKFEELPDLTNLKRMGLLNIQSCGIRRIKTAFGKDHLFKQFLAPDNKISSLPVDVDGYFVGLHNNFETLDFSYNEFTELPNIFDGNSIFTVNSISFANNKISKIQGQEDGSWKGVKATILALGYNQLTEFPQFFNDNETCSQIGYLQLQGNGIVSFPEKALEGDRKKIQHLQSIDLSMNKLTELPNNFSALSLPYLYGLDLSRNRFESFQFKPLNCASLTTYIFRGQRDAKGNRCMKQWPTGVYQHKGLRALFLGSNDIRKMDDQRLSYLIYNLEISDNPNITIDVSSVCSYIRAGVFRLAYDSDQDIRGCDALDLDK